MTTEKYATIVVDKSLNAQAQAFQELLGTLGYTATIEKIDIGGPALLDGLEQKLASQGALFGVIARRVADEKLPEGIQYFGQSKDVGRRPKFYGNDAANNAWTELLAKEPKPKTASYSGIPDRTYVSTGRYPS